jgi:hypothetical protein
VQRSIRVEYNWGTEFILDLLSVRALDEFVYSARDMQQYEKVVRVECCWALQLWKEQNEAFPTVPPAGQTDKWKAFKPRVIDTVKAKNVPKWAQRSQESIWKSGGEVRDGAEKPVMECEMCTDNDEGRGWEFLPVGPGEGLGISKGSGSKGCRGAEHGQACTSTKERTGAVAVRAALESAVQVGRGDEGKQK